MIIFDIGRLCQWNAMPEIGLIKGPHHTHDEVIDNLYSL